MITLYAKKSGCSCCVATLRFHSMQSAMSAVGKYGLGHYITIVDDIGNVLTNVDTLSGFFEEYVSAVWAPRITPQE